MIAQMHDALLEHIRDEVARRRRELDCLAQHAPARERQAEGTTVAEPLHPLDLQSVQPTGDRVRLRDLLQYHDRRFVEQAYWCLLKRPMGSGDNWYLDRLRKGSSKIATLLQIRYSREGKTQRVRVRGLRIYRMLFAVTRMPLFGFLFRAVAYVVRWLACLLTLPRQQKQQEASRQYVMSLFTAVEDHINLNQRQLNARLAGYVTDSQFADAREDLERKQRSVESKIDLRLDALEQDCVRLDNALRVAQSEMPIRKTVDELDRRLDELQSAMPDIQQIVERLSDLRQVIQQMPAIVARLSDLERADQRRMSQEIPSLVQRLADLESGKQQVDDVAQQVRSLQEKQVELGERIRGFGELNSLIAALGDSLQRLNQLKDLRSEIDILSRRLARIEPPTVDGDDFYASLEDHFRGSTEEIRSRQQHNVVHVETAGAGTAEAPILDLGCGRGEWLGLLRDRGLVARGIDTNEVFLERCRRDRLPVQRDDAIRHLEMIAPASLGAITGFHIIEHMTANEQVRLVQLAFRALRPGGILILETPNPEHLSVAALRFYLDPTHVRPVPAPLLEFMARQAGFGEIQIERRAPSGDGEAAQGWSRFQDYAIIARRPH